MPIVVRDRRAVLGHAEEVLLAPARRPSDRERDLVGLAVADADDVTLVADDDERREREATAALDDLRDAVDLDDALLQIATVDTCSADRHESMPFSFIP